MEAASRTTRALLIARRPDDIEGDFYRVLPEGTIRNWDGVTIPIAPPLEGLDLNRNWPADWAPEAEQQGAGPFPTSEPEVRALVEAIVERKNITSYVGYHTFSGVHLRPWSGRSDDDFPVPDLRAFKLMGEEATRLTGYPAISIFHDFKYHPKMVIKGGDVDWIYDHLGAYAWVTEFWSPQRAAGLSDYHFIDWIREHSPEDELAVLKVADELGEGYVDWYPFEHPQLGPVELGGWDLVRFWFNPPLSRLEEEVKPHADFALYLALVSPRLEIRSFESEPVADGAFRLRLVLENAGWLPTNVSEKALERKAVRPIEVELELPDGARIATGKEREEAGQLGGRVERRQVTWWNTDHSTAERTLVEWVVEAKAGDRVGVVARHERAGTVRAELDPLARRLRAMRAMVLDASRRATSSSRNFPIPYLKPGRCFCAFGRAACAGPTSTSSTASSRSRSSRSSRATRSSARCSATARASRPATRVGVPGSAGPDGDVPLLRRRARRTSATARASPATTSTAATRSSPWRTSASASRAGGLLGRAGGAAPVRRSDRLPLAPPRRRAEAIGLYGFGASAHIVCQVAVAQGRRVFAGTRAGDDETQEFARSLGAVWAGDAAPARPEELDAVIVFAPVGELVPAALRHVRKGGSVVCAGIHMSDIPSFPYEWLWGERVVRSVANLTRADGEEFLEARADNPCPHRGRDVPARRRRTRRSTVSAAATCTAPRSSYRACRARVAS